MEGDWEAGDEDGYAGPDGYLEDEDQDVEDQMLRDDPDITEEQEEGSELEDDDGLNAQRQSIMGLLDSAFISIVPATQTVRAGFGGFTANLTSSLTIDQVRLLLATAQSRSLQGSIHFPTMLDDDDDDEEEDPDYIPAEDDHEDSYFYPWGGRWPRTRNWFKPVTEPQKAGVQLMNGGEFGRLKAKKVRNLRRMIKERQSGFKGRGRGVVQEDFARNLAPNSDGTIVATYDSNAYSGQYSADSSFYYSCCQDWRLHVYDTTAPFRPATGDTESSHTLRRFGSEAPEHVTTMKTIRTVDAVPGSWTITDSHLSPDNERLIYSAMTSIVYMTKTFQPYSPQVPLRFGREGSHSFHIYSCRFSADGKEVIAGGNAQQGELRVYDLHANRTTVNISAHASDINSCCWADSSSGNVLVSASDDTFLKVWDRRSLGSTQKPSGILVGHTEGITYVSAKGDGRYVLSNGKDQAMRLWDLRKMRSDSELETFRDRHYGQPGFDYRHVHYVKPKYSAHPKDCSVMTYRGHQVFRTLIRCHFSPAETTGSNYLYTGSSDGRIHVYSLDGRIVQVLDRRRTLPISYDPSERDPGEPLASRRSAPVCVRDVSWHSQEPVLMSVAWESSHGRSSVARHEWKGIGKWRGGTCKIEDYVERQKLEQAERARARTAHGSRMPGSYGADGEEQ